MTMLENSVRICKIQIKPRAVQMVFMAPRMQATESFASGLFKILFLFKTKIQSFPTLIFVIVLKDMPNVSY